MFNDETKCYEISEENRKRAEEAIASGVKNFLEKKMLEALKCYTRALKLNPLSAAALYCRGRVEAALGQAHLALWSFSVACNLDPENETFSQYHEQLKEKSREASKKPIQQQPTKGSTLFYPKEETKKNDESVGGNIMCSTIPLKCSPTPLT